MTVETRLNEAILRLFYLNFLRYSNNQSTLF